MTPRVRNILETRWEAAGKPADGWAWVAPTRNSRVESSSLKKQHARIFEALSGEAAKNNEKAIRPFVVYSPRHTFLTRLGESGCDAWTLARIAGHNNVVFVFSLCSSCLGSGADRYVKAGWAQNYAKATPSLLGKPTGWSLNAIPSLGRQCVVWLESRCK
jgi:hypothetical protein